MMIKLINNHLIYVPFASGKIIDNNFIWFKVTWIKCNICGMYHSNRKIPREYWNGYRKKSKIKAGVILVKGDYIYVTQSYNNKYGFPKGTVENGEEIRDAAIRETYEESGYMIKNGFENMKYMYLKYNKIEYHFYVVNIDVDIIWDYIPIDDVETTTFGWSHKDDVLKLNLSKPMRKVFLKFNHTF